jgi:hypothetical protein
MKNKRGIELNISTIIILVLAILVLVIIALYFTGGLKTLWDRIRGVNTVFNPQDVELAKQECESRDLQSYCSQKVSLKIQNETSPSIQKYCYEDPIFADLRYSENGTIWMPHTIAAQSGKCDVYQG